LIEKGGAQEGRQAYCLGGDFTSRKKSCRQKQREKKKNGRTSTTGDSWEKGKELMNGAQKGRNKRDRCARGGMGECRWGGAHQDPARR